VGVWVWVKEGARVGGREGGERGEQEVMTVKGGHPMAMEVEVWED